MCLCKLSNILYQTPICVEESLFPKYPLPIQFFIQQVCISSCFHSKYIPL